MIEVWTPRGIRAIQLSPDTLQRRLKEVLVMKPQTPEVKEAIEGFVEFLMRLHAITGVGGVAFSCVNEPPARPTFYISVLAPLSDSDDSARIMKEVSYADVELFWKLNPVMPSGMRFYNSTQLGPNTFLSVLRGDFRKSRNEELFRVFLFKRDD